MAEEKLMPAGRLAMRVEGLWWRAYYAKNETMNGALLLGCIHMRCVEKSPELKTAFMDVMRDAVSILLKDVSGVDSVWPNDPQPAPEHERGGNA